LATLLNALSPKRLELPREFHREPARSIKALAERLKRDYKRVHEDVGTPDLGLLQREGGHVTAAYDVIDADFDLRSAA
jgi:predicted transcriptional regulator